MIRFRELTTGTRIGLLIVTATVLVAIFAPLIAPYDPIATDAQNALAGASWQHWLGTDQYGRDVLSRTIEGGRFALLVSVLATTAAVAIGTLIGAISAYYGRWVDGAVTRVLDAVLAVPAVLALLLIVSVFGNALWVLVGIARALAAEPTLLIADEITTALDVSVQAAVLQLLEQLRDQHALACLFISHDLAVVRSISDRIVVMKDGLMVETAPTAALFDNPRHPYTRTLLDAVVEPGHVDLPSSDADARVIAIDPSAPLVDVGGGHQVRRDEGAILHP